MESAARAKLTAFLIFMGFEKDIRSTARAWGLGLCFMLGSGAASAEPLSWQACVDTTSRKNPELLAARSAVRAAEYQHRGAYAGYLPQISAATSLTRDSLTLRGSPVVTNTGYTASLMVSENLFAGLQDRGKIAEAKAKREAALATLTIVEARLSYELKSAFADLAFAQKSRELNQTIFERREANRRLVQLRFETGHENKGSLLLSESYREQAELDRLQAQNAVIVSEAQLARVLGQGGGTLDGAESLSITGQVPLTAAPLSADFSKLALSVPEYQSAKAQERAADAVVTQSRSPFFPALNVTGSIGNDGGYFYPNNDQRWAVGVVLTLPLFNGGKDYYGMKSAMETRKAAAFGLENVLRQSSAKLKSALAAYSVAVRKLEVDRGFLQAATIRSRIGREKYNNGLLSFEDWDLIENDFIQRQKTLLQSEHDRVTAEAAWEQSQGKGVFQ